jgi:hypothetical protein
MREVFSAPLAKFLEIKLALNALAILTRVIIKTLASGALKFD